VKSSKLSIIGVVVLLLISHLTAYFFGYLSLEKKAVVQPTPGEFKNPSPRGSTGVITTKIPENIAEQIPNLPHKDISPPGRTAYSLLHNLIEDLHPEQLNSYLSKYFDKDDLEKINGHEIFAQRLLDLYSGESTEIESSQNRVDAEIAIGINENYPQQPTNHLSITSREGKIYAHLKLHQSPSLLSEVFVKWERIADNKLLLFEKKPINPLSNTNWVSLIPQDGWQDGEYHVSFYTFDSEMQTIAGMTYFLSVTY